MSICAVTVYCSSSDSLAAHYYAAAAELGCAIANNGWTLVYGGNALGMMKTLADSARASGGRVIGITPQIFVDKGFGDNDSDELIVTTDLRERRQLMEQRGDAFVALPGGIGTMEEIIEIIVGKHMSVHAKPIVLLNVAGYWNPLLAMIDSAVEQKFIKPKVRDLYYVATDVAETIAYLRSCPPQPTDDRAGITMM